MIRYVTIPILCLVVFLAARGAHADERDVEQRALDWLLFALAEEVETKPEHALDMTPVGKRFCAVTATAFLLEVHPERERYAEQRKRLEAEIVAFLDSKPGFIQCTWLYGFMGLWLAEKGLRGDDVSAHFERILARLAASANPEGGWSHDQIFNLPFYPPTLIAATNWSLLTLGSGRRLGIVPEGDAVERALALLEKVQGESGAFPYGGSTYRKGYEAGRTAGSVAALAALGRQETKVFQRAAAYVLKDPSAVPRGHASPAMHVLLGSLAFRLLGDEAWSRWDAEVLSHIRGYQREDGTFDILVTGTRGGIEVGLTDRATNLYITACCAAGMAMPRSRLAAALRAEVPMPTPPVPAAPTYVETAWSAKVDAGSRLVAENGRVFLLSRAAGLEVIRGDDGTVVLKHDLQVPVGEALVPVNLTVSGKDALIWMVEESMAYHAGAPLTLVVCNLADGAVRWTRPLGERPVTLAERAGRLHILFLDSSSVVLSTEDGEEIRREPAGSVPPINHGLALDGSGGEALAVQLRVAVRDASGQVRWERTLPVEDDFAAPVYGALAWIDPLLVASRSDGVLVAYRVDDGTEVWQVEGRCGIASLTPLGAGRGLLVQDFEGVVRSMTTGDAKEQWSFAPPRVRENARPRPPICREGLVALPSPGDGITFFLDAETGEVLHALRTSPAAQLAIDAGMIYVLDHDRLWALRRPVADRSTPDTPGRLEQRAPSE